VACDPKNGPLMRICPLCKTSKITVTAADEDERGTYMCNNKDCTNYKMDIEFRDSYGIGELLKTTVQLLPEMVASSFQNAQKDFLEDLDTVAQHRIAFYVTAAGGIGATPIPFSDFPLLLANEVAMVTNLANVYGLPLNGASIRQWIWALMSTAGVAGVGMAFGSLIKLIPGWGTIAGGATNCLIASSFTFGLGMLAMELFRKVRGLAVHGEVTADHFAQVMSIDKQKAFLMDKISEWRAIKNGAAPDKKVH